jgi:hypothetical protein
MQVTEDYWTRIVLTAPCPFLTCQETRPHRHAICPACKAARYGNAGCAQCRLARLDLNLPTLKLEEARP